MRSLAAFRRQPAIEMLLDKYPQAAMIPNDAERFALSLAIENYSRWDEAWRMRDSKMHFWMLDAVVPRVSFEDTILKLVGAAPGALEARDTKTHLSPFLLAAAVDVPLSLLYNLLQANPMVVQCGVQKTNYEIYLEHKLKRLEAKKPANQAMRGVLERERDELLGRLQDIPGETNYKTSNSRKCKRGFLWRNFA